MILSPGDFSYSGDPATSKKDAIRFLIGDTDDDDMILTDAEIEWIVADRGDTNNLYLTAADAADLAGIKYSRVINRQTGTLNLSLGATNPFAERAKELRRLVGERKVGPVFASNDLAAEVAASGGRRRPLFWLGQFDYPPNGPEKAPTDRSSTYPPLGGPW